MSQSTRCSESRLRPLRISAQGLSRNNLPVPAGGTLGIPRLARVPAMEITTRTRPITPSRSFQAANIMLPSEVPRRMARKVLISNSPLARERSLSGSNSGRMPYLAGLKKVACRAIKNRTPSINSIRPDRNAKNPSPIAPISKALVTTRTVRLLQASAACPA